VCVDNHIGLSPITNIDRTDEVLPKLRRSIGVNNLYIRYLNEVKYQPFNGQEVS